MDEYCLTHNYDTNPRSNRDSMGSIIVDDEHKIIYCAITKVACTTWKGVLARLRGLKNVHVRVCCKFMGSLTAKPRHG